jgi:hypothetical protein
MLPTRLTSQTLMSELGPQCDLIGDGSRNTSPPGRVAPAAPDGTGFPNGAGSPATTFAQWRGFPWTLSFTAEPTAAGEVVSAAFSLKQGGLPCNKGCIGWITIR